MDLAATWNNLGLVELHVGRLDEALAAYNRALEIFRETNNRKDHAVSLVNIASARNLRGDPVEALAPPAATGSVPDQQDEVSA